MSLEVPELFQANTTDVHNVVTLRDGGLWIAAGDHGAQGRVEISERLIQGKQAGILVGDVGYCGL